MSIDVKRIPVRPKKKDKRGDRKQNPKELICLQALSNRGIGLWSARGGFTDPLPLE